MATPPKIPIPVTTVGTTPVVTNPVTTNPILTNPVVTNPVVTNPIGTIGTNPIITNPIGAAPTALSPSNPSVSSSTSSVAVTVPNQSGTVTFSLVVTDNLNQQSQPATFTVTIQSGPVAKLTATPAVVAAGGAITLSGDGSTSSGTISNFKFSLVTPNTTG